MNDSCHVIEQLRQQIECLEHQQRRQRRLLFTLLLPFALLLWMAARQPPQKLQLEPVPPEPSSQGALQSPVVAPKFVVQNSEGQVRALLDSQGLFLFGADRTLRVWLTPEDLVFKGPKGRIRLALKAARDSRSVVVRDDHGNEADLGTLHLTSPATTHHRNAASLVFQHDGVVLRELP